MLEDEPLDGILKELQLRGLMGVDCHQKKLRTKGPKAVERGSIREGEDVIAAKGAEKAKAWRQNRCLVLVCFPRQI